MTERKNKHVIRRRYEPPNDDDLYKLITTVRSSSKRTRERDALLIFLLSRTGMRLNEALTLRLSDIDFEDNNINIRPEIAKTRQERNIFMIPLLKRLLHTYIIRNKDKIIKSDNYLFYSQHLNRERKSDRHLHKTSWNYVYKEYLKMAGLYKVKFYSKNGKAHTIYRTHDLRKYFAYNIFRMNPNARLNEVALCTGHKSLKVLSEIYIQANSKDTQKRLLNKTFEKRKDL